MALTWKELSSPYSFALSSFYNYQPAKHLEFISDHIGAMYRREAPPILLLDGPPRHGKSDMVSWAVPSQFIHNCPHGRIIHSSYSEKVSKRFGRLNRNTYRKYGKDFNGFGLSNEVNSAGNWETTAGGGMMCVGRGGSLTSFGANLIIIDDAIRNAKEALSSNIREGLKDWWGSTVYTRMEPGSIAIIANTRWHEDDLTGHLLEQSAKDKGFALTHIRLPAIATEGDVLGRAVGEALWPERWPIEELLKKKSGMNPYWWRALWDQDPSNPTGTEFRSEYFDDIFVDEKDWPDSLSNPAMGVDPSKGSRKGDFQGVVKVGGHGRHLYVDSDIDRTGIDELAERICQLSQGGCDGLLLEANGFQGLLDESIDAAIEEGGFMPFPIHPITAMQPKELRIKRLDFWLRRRLLKFKDTPSNRILVGQLKDFPFGTHDDGPDALEMAIRMWKHLVYDTSPEDVQDDVNDTLRA